MVTTLIAQMSNLLAPNIQIYDAHVVDLHQWACARYLVGVEAAETKARLNSALDRISERITLASELCPAQRQSAGQTSTLCFNEMAERVGVKPTIFDHSTSSN